MHYAQAHMLWVHSHFETSEHCLMVIMQFAKAVEENAILQRLVEGATRQYALINQQLQLVKQHAVARDIEQMSLLQSIASLHHPM